MLKKTTKKKTGSAETRPGAQLLLSWSFACAAHIHRCARTHSSRIHWESAESMFYRAIIRLVFGEGVKQTGAVRS